MSPSSPKRPSEKIRFGYGSLVALSVVAVVLAAGMIGLSRAGARVSRFVVVPPTSARPTTGPAPTTAPTPTSPTVQPQGDPKSLGAANAPVTIVEFEDFK